MNRTDISEAIFSALLARDTTEHVADGEYEGSTWQLASGNFLCESDGAFWILHPDDMPAIDMDVD